LKINCWLAVIPLCLSSIIAFSQTQEITNLKAKLAKATDTKVKADLCHSLAAVYWDYDFEKGMEYSRQCLALSQRIDYQLGEIKGLTDFGLYYYYQGNYPKAMTFYRLAVKKAEGKNFGDFPSYTNTRIGNIFRFQAQFDSAQSYYDLSIDAPAGTIQPFALSSAYYNTGLLYSDLSNYEKSLYYLHRSLHMRVLLHDSALIAETWNAVGFAHKGLSNYDSANYYYNKFYKVTKQLKDPELLMLYSINKGELLFLSDDFKGAIQLYLQALDILKAHEFKRYHGIILKKIGQVFLRQNDFPRALEYLLNSLKIEETLNGRQQIAQTYSLISWMYVWQKNFRLADENATRSLKLMTEIKDEFGIAFTNNLLGVIAREQKEYDKALQYFKTALQIRKEINHKEGIAGTTYNIAMVFRLRKQYDKAFQFFFEEINLDQKLNNKEGLCLAYNEVGATYSEIKNFSLASHYLSKGEALARETHSLPQLRKSFQYFSALYKAQGNYQKALIYSDKFIALNDSVNNNQGTIKVAEINALYQIDKKEEEIAQLQNDNNLKQSQIELQNTRIRSQTGFLIFAVTLVLSVVIAILILYRYYQVQDKANKELKNLNQLINEKNEEILTQAEELRDSNNLLSRINKELAEKQDEIATQNEELIQSNEEILSQRDLVNTQKTKLEEANIIIEKQNMEIKLRNENLEKEVDKRTKELVEYNQQLEQFAFISSHNLRAPVARILGLGQLLEISGNNASDVAFIHQGLTSTAFELDRVVRDLNTILEVKKNNSSVLVDINFEEELKLVKINLEKEITETGTQIHTDFSKAPLIKTIRPYLDSILMNLISNAIKYRKPELSPVISIKTESKDEFVCMTVSDNGLGINLTLYRDKLFSLYSRFHDHVDGKGLGLYLVKTQVQALGGKIEVERNESSGLTFHIFFKSGNVVG